MCATAGSSSHGLWQLQWPRAMTTRCTLVHLARLGGGSLGAARVLTTTVDQVGRTTSSSCLHVSARARLQEAGSQGWCRKLCPLAVLIVHAFQSDPVRALCGLAALPLPGQCRQIAASIV